MRPVEISIEHAENSRHSIIPRAGYGGEQIDLPAIGKGMEQSDGANIVIVGTHIRIKDQGHSFLKMGLGASQNRKQEQDEKTKNPKTNGFDLVHRCQYSWIDIPNISREPDQKNH
jgi:hypothetical protein